MKTEILIGIIIFLTQLPESVAFAFLAKLTPPVGLHSAWIVGLISAVFGGRPGMISGAAGARATIIGAFLGAPARPGLNGEGAEIVFPSVIISGFLMLIIYAFRLYRFTKIIPESVMVGFLNGIGILIVVSQIFSFQEDNGMEWRSGPELGFMVLICLTAVLIMELIPKIPCSLSNLMPSSLLALIVGAILEFALVRPLGFLTNTIGDVAEITEDQRFPIPFMIDPQYDLSGLQAPGVPERIFTLSVLLCAVGSIETLLTAEVVTEVVKTPNNPSRVMLALGGANIIAGFLGGVRPAQTRAGGRAARRALCAHPTPTPPPSSCRSATALRPTPRAHGVLPQAWVATRPSASPR
jgi:SulP family sulfate permease